jgi:DNA-binding SARP family transcriptional activator
MRLREVPVHQTLLETATRLLGEHRYSEAARVVQALERECAAAGDTLRAGVLRVAVELCLACGEQQAERETHLRIEATLRSRLQAMLDDASDAEHIPTPPVEATAQRPQGDAALAVHFLGPTLVYRDGRLLAPWPNRRAKSLFMYLVTHRTWPVPKELLMDQFWPDAGASAGRNSLNVAVHGLRRFLRISDDGVNHILFKGDSYSLNPAVSLWVDIEEFDRQVATARRRDRATDVISALEAAAILYRGPLFEDEPYEEWCSGLRRRLQESYVDVLERLCDHHLAAGEFAACADAGRKILVLEPTHEKAHIVLMRCFARQGRYSLAQRQYQDCVGELRASLDLSPSESMNQIFARIKAREPV